MALDLLWGSFLIVASTPGGGWDGGSDLLLVHHYILFILHAVWIAGPGALGHMIYMFLYCTSCCVILTLVSCILTIIPLTRLILHLLPLLF